MFPRTCVLLAFAAACAFAQARPEQHRGPYLNLSDGRTVPTRYERPVLSGARALSTTKADFDEDGMPDLAAGFATIDGGGAVAIHRGNVQALWPYHLPPGVEPPAFLPDARIFDLPEAPDFLAAGDFDADGHWDIVAARSGSSQLYWLKGNGHGGFAPAQSIPLPGAVTAMTYGDINRSDGLTDLIVAVTGAGGPQLLVFESPDCALRGTPETIALPGAATALAVFPMDGGLVNGLAVAAGRELLLIHGRDRKLTRPRAEREAVPPAEVNRQTLPFAVRSLAVGSFTSPTLDLAALGDDGQVHIFERSDVTGKRTHTSSLTHRTAIALPVVNPRKLVAASVAASGHDSLIVLDPDARKLHIVSHQNREDATSMAVTASLDVDGPPAAVEPMRINKDGQHDLVVLSESHPEPIVHTTAPDMVFTVTNTLDWVLQHTSTFEGYVIAPGSLRNAFDLASQAVASGSTVEIDFNIPTTDPNRDPTTGLFTIQPLYLVSIFVAIFSPSTITIDGYTQPGSSPNTLTNGDNARPLVEINGGLVPRGPSAVGLYGAGSVVRGLTITNFTSLPVVGNPYLGDGGIALVLASESDFIEGNFLGIDIRNATQSLIAYQGIVTSNASGVLTLSSNTEPGSTVGGTVPQARNLISGNYNGLYITQYSTPNTFLIQGNYIGADSTGASEYANTYGVALLGTNTVVGGATAGAGNLISANSESSVESVAGESGALIQGNLIGTDLTGTQGLRQGLDGVALGGAGDTLGGTTPAARNIISNASSTGVSLLADSENHLVEGNYIGLDVTGSVAIPNLFGVSLGTSYLDIYNLMETNGASFNSTIGGEAAGAANVISGNGSIGVVVVGQNGTASNDVISGNLIGTDATGAKPLGNQGDGIQIRDYATNNTVGGTDPPAANIIAYNTGNGVKIDPGGPNTTTFGVSSNNVIGNSIYSNGGVGVSVATGTANRISQNRIYSNSGLGIELNNAGVLPNSACQTNTNGANLLQNAPILTAGSGTAFVTATATDPLGNTSEFSNCVSASLTNNVLNFIGTLNSTPSTTYTIEYFSNTSCDPSGFGQGQTYLGSTTYTTAPSTGQASCTTSVNGALNLTNADLAVTNTSTVTPVVNIAFPFTSVVTNSGPSAAVSVTWTDPLPSDVALLAAATTQGACTVASGTITCNLGNLEVGGTVTISVSVLPSTTGTFSNTVAVTSTTADSNLANNSATYSHAIVYSPFPDHLSPAVVCIGSPETAVTIVGQGFTAASVVTYGGVTYAATFNGNWNPNDCGKPLDGGVNYCTALTFTLPAAQLAAAATVQVGIQGFPQTLTFNAYNNCPPVPGPVSQFLLSGIGATYPAGSQAILTVTAADAHGVTVPTYTGTVNLTTTDPAPNVFTSAGGSSTLTFTAANQGQQYPFVELQTFGTQSITATDASNGNLKGSIGTVVANGPASNLTLGGTPQATPPGTKFPAPLQVTVTDLYGNPVPNQLLTFTPPSSGASATLSSTTATTNSQGVASVTATANGTSGPYAVGVTFGAAVAGGGDNADVFLLNNGSGLATLTATAGTPQSTFIGQLFATKLQATLKDGLGNPISGATVYFASGNVNGANALVPASAVTNASGVATAQANAPSNVSAGTFPVTATAGGLTAIFTLTENVPEPVVMSMTGGTPQTTTVGTAFDAPLTLNVKDGNGNALSGALVTFVPPSTGASATFASGVAMTDGNGNASLAATANHTAGTYNVVASISDVSVNFALTNTPLSTGPPASVTPIAGTPQSQPIAQQFVTAFQVRVKDANGNPYSGATVTFTPPASGPSGTFGAPATVTTDGEGYASAPAFTANTVAGAYSVTATAGSVSATFSLTNLPGPAVNIVIYAGNNQSATVNTTYGTALAAQLVDSYGNSAGPGYSVVFGVTPGTSGAAATFSGSAIPTVTTGSNGVAIAPSLTANGTAGALTVTTAFEYVNGTTVTYPNKIFTLTNTTASPGSLAAFAGTPQSTAAGTAFPTALSAKVTDAQSNPLAGFTVTFTAPATGASAVLSSPSAITNASGIATVTANANAAGGSYNVIAAIGTYNAAFALTNVAQNRCDLNLDGVVNVLDVQIGVNEALGKAPPANDLTGDQLLSVVDVQIVINAARNLGCSAH